MKRFSEFILEYRGSRAAEKAYRLGLVSNKHGEWVDRSGKVVARTVNGDLEMVRKKSPSPEKQAPIQATPKQAEPPQTKSSLGGMRGESEPKQEEPPAPEMESDSTLTVVFGRFNPPTIGHEKLFKKAKEISSGGELKIYPSRSQDNKKNPLDPSSKIKYMKKMFPDFKDNIVNDQDMISIYDVLYSANEDGYTKINIVVGSDRLSEFDRLAKQQNGKLYNFDELNVVTGGLRDPDSMGVEGTSAARLRKAAVEDDYTMFRAGLPKRMKSKDAMALFFAVQRVLIGKKQNIKNQYIKVRRSKSEKNADITELWKYAPELDISSLREEYYLGNIFNVGDIVESLNTGLIGTVTHRGSNYLICVTEDGIMFKSWITDLTEWTDNSGVPANQREVGTDSLRKYAMEMSNTSNIQNFIKKYKKSVKLYK